MSESENPENKAAGFDSWLAEIQRIGGTDPLRFFRDNSFGQVNLDRAHPGGLAQFVTGRPTLLSNLVRDPLSFSRALSAAKRIKQKQLSLSEQFGLETLYMASGLVDLTADGHYLKMPILLWPVNLVTRKDDFELSLSRKAIVNPALAPALYKSYGVRLNNEDLLAHVQVGSDPIPIKILDHIASLTEQTGNPELRRALVISNFSSAAIDLAGDFRRTENPVLNLFMSEEAQTEFTQDGLADPVLVTDYDHVQAQVVSRALAGSSFAIETLPGCGYLQTVVLTLAALAHQGKRVLVLAPRRQTINELADRLAQVGLPGLGIRSSSTWLDMISAISRNEKATDDSYQALSVARHTAREEVANYFLALNNIDGELGVSIEQALENLAALAASRRPPVNEARIEPDALGRHRDRAFALTLLRQAHELGEFEFGPEDSAWFRAHFEHPGEIDARIALARALYQTAFEKLSGQLRDFTKAVDFAPAETVNDWVAYLELFVGIRESLDKFKPEVFDRPINELILATAPRKDKSVMSGANRRRLKKLAKEYLRPGMHVGDLHQALKNIQAQRDAWQRNCQVSKPPQVPLGIKEAQLAVGTFVSDLELLQQHLDPENDSLKLTEMKLGKLNSTLRSLAEDTKLLENYSERAMTEQRLDEAGLGPLSRDLSRLHASKDALPAELELAWWKSALETLLARTGHTLAGDFDRVVKNEERFASAESELIAEGAKLVARSLSSRWKDVLARFPSEAQTLKELLKLKRAVISEISQLAPNVYQALTPIVMLSPYEVPSQVTRNEGFDVAMVLDGAGSSVAENLSGLSRVNQVLVFGDDVIAAASGFELECRPEPEDREIPESIFTKAKKVMPLISLHHSYRNSGQVLGDYINQEFYDNRITFEPTEASYFGRRNVQLEKIVKDSGGESDSSDAEIEQTLELIFNHALWRPEDSLLVATLSEKHANRLEQALVSGIRAKAHLAEFFEGHGREKFEIATIRDLSHRVADRIIFSTGVQKVDRQMPATLGQLSLPDAKRYLANLLVSARKQLTLVTSFETADLVGSQVPGAPLLHELLVEIQRPVSPQTDITVNPMISDLAIRLTRLGVTTRTNFSSRLSLIASVGNRACVVDPDWALIGDTLSDRLRGRPNLLTAMGWEYVRVPSFELFADPEAVAIRIASHLGIEVSKKPQALFEFEDRAFEDTPAAWGDGEDNNDRRLEEDRPPHWG